MDQPPVCRPEGNPWGPSVLRVICVTIEQSYNRGCTIARWLRRSLLKRKVPTGCLQADRREADPLYRGLIISTDYDCGQRFTLERTEPCANATTRERGGWLTTAPGQGLRIKPDAWVTPGYSRTQEAFSVIVSLAGIEPVGFRVKSDLRNH